MAASITGLDTADESEPELADSRVAQLRDLGRFLLDLGGR